MLSLTLRAMHPGDRGFTGVLCVCIQAREGADYEQAVMRFRDGVAEAPLAVEVGPDPVQLWLQGLGEATGTWMPASDVVTISGETTGPINFRLAGGRLRLRVLSPEGEVLRGYRLNLQAGGSVALIDPWLYVQADPQWMSEDGWCSLWLNPGNAQLSVSKAGFEKAKQTVMVPPDGQTLDITVTLTR